MHEIIPAGIDRLEAVSPLDESDLLAGGALAYDASATTYLLFAIDPDADSGEKWRDAAQNLAQALGVLDSDALNSAIADADALCDAS